MLTSLYKQAQRAALEALPLVAELRSTVPTESCPDGIRIIPIYFHILHNGGSASLAGDNNFTVAEIQTAVDNLNMHYAGTNPQLSRVQDQFWADGRVSSNTCIQFCWNPVDIHRLNVNNAPHNIAMFTDTAGVVQSVIQPAHDAVSGASPSLNKCQYMNVYTGPYGIGQTGGGTTGYAWSLFSSFAGVRIDENAFVPGGFITNTIANRGLTFAHETGHLLGLSPCLGRHQYCKRNGTDSFHLLYT